MINMTFPTLVMVILASWALCGGAVPSFMRRKRKGDYLDKVAHMEEDLISQLPDDVLVLIISRLTTTSSVRTSILSKRWRNLYKSVPSIELSYTDLMPQYHYALHPDPHISKSDFGLIIYRLERFLRLRSGSKIHDFYLSANLIKPNDEPLEKCIYYLEKSSVESLQLLFRDCSCCPRPTFSLDLVSELATLKDLALGFCCPLPPKLKSKWNSLTSLSLIACLVPPGFWECILSNCLNFESLTILSCRCPPKLCVAGPSLRLKTLVVRNADSIEEIELHASNLTEFEYFTGKMANLVFDYVPQLETMYMSIESSRGERVSMMPYIFREVAKYVPSLKFLRFETKAYFNQDVWIGRSRFWKLRVLNMTVDWTPTHNNLLELIPYLQSCPVLEELQLNFDYLVGEVVGEVSNEVIEMRKLKKVEINGFGGTDNEIEFALFILKTAPSLHQMCIIRCPFDFTGEAPWTEQTLQNIKQNLLGQALSPTARLIFRHHS